MYQSVPAGHVSDSHNYIRGEENVSFLNWGGGFMSVIAWFLCHINFVNNHICVLIIYF